VPYETPKKVAIVNVLDEVSDEPAPGYVEFLIDGRPYKLDAVGDDEGLFFIFKDRTAGDTTYGSGRFLYIDKKPSPARPSRRPEPGLQPALRLQRIHHLPAAAEAEHLPVRVEAGEKYPPRKKG
jgi:uncharacterized protein (DUF1684 family)